MFTDKVKFFLPPNGGEGVAFALRASSQRCGADAAARTAYAAFLLARDGAPTVTGEANCESVRQRERCIIRYLTVLRSQYRQPERVRCSVLAAWIPIDIYQLLELS